MKLIRQKIEQKMCKLSFYSLVRCMLRYLIFLALLLPSVLVAEEFCTLLEQEGQSFIQSEKALACETNADCSYVSSNLLNCGCPGLFVGKGLETYQALEKVHEDICGINCIAECIIFAYRSEIITTRKGPRGKRVRKKLPRMGQKLFCEKSICVEKVVKLD